MCSPSTVSRHVTSQLPTFTSAQSAATSSPSHRHVTATSSATSPDMWEVGIYHFFLMGPLETELVYPNLVRPRRFVAFPLCWLESPANELPTHCNVFKVIQSFFILVQGHDQALVPDYFAEFDSLGQRVLDLAEVYLSCIEKLVS
ncbi:unnamed protein product [Cuscuta epithymum]|uniref:Uncharacterized protein n=1 Tax=Cuscuta epithymum TaxID=186058 RepID=A0AAV0G5Q4_9ASTE|nr:unnamed protein product [Cuscuta epithymum]